MLRSDGPDIDLLSPVDRTFPLVARRRHWFLGLPGDAGKAWRDLANPGVVAPLAYHPLANTRRPGGWREVRTSTAGTACTTVVDGGSGEGMSLAYWARADDLTGGFHCVWRTAEWGNSSFYRSGSNWGFYNDSGTLVAATPVVVGRWVRWLLAVTGHGGAGGTIRVYRDGVFAEEAALNPLVFTAFGAATITFGNDAFGQTLNGAVDDFALYPYALDDAGAIADYAQSVGSYPDGLARATSALDAALLAGETPAGLAPRPARPRVIGVGIY